MARATNIVVIGGGHGSSVALSGLSELGADLTGILAMADNGGSTGRLRRELNVSAVGDIRNCLVTLAGSKELGELFSYRFNSGELDGHSLGNLFLAAGELSSGSLQYSIDLARQALAVETKILPISLDNSQLKYIGKTHTVLGMHEIAKLELEAQPNLSLEPKSEISDLAKQSIAEADLIVIAPGNFYCSIAQVLLVDGVAEALENTSAKVVFITNLVNIDRQTAGFSPLDYLREVNRLLGREVVDHVIYNNQMIQRGVKDGESPVVADFDKSVVGNVSFQAENLIDQKLVIPDPKDKIAFIRSNIRHDSQKLAKLLIAL